MDLRVATFLVAAAAGSPGFLTPMLERLEHIFPAASNVTSSAYDASTGLARFCYGQCTAAGGGFTIVARAAVLAEPPSSAGTVANDMSIGRNLKQLLDSLHKDDHLAGKNLIADASGTVTMIEAKDQDPPPSRYDHGYQVTTMQFYLFQNGVVAAHGWGSFEN